MQCLPCSAWSAMQCLVCHAVSGLPCSVRFAMQCLVCHAVSGLPWSVWFATQCLVCHVVSGLPCSVWSAMQCMVDHAMPGLYWLLSHARLPSACPCHALHFPADKETDGKTRSIRISGLVPVRTTGLNSIIQGKDCVCQGWSWIRITTILTRGVI